MRRAIPKPAVLSIILVTTPPLPRYKSKSIASELILQERLAAPRDSSSVMAELAGNAEQIQI
jgi:hypothetical protein